MTGHRYWNLVDVLRSLGGLTRGLHCWAIGFSIIYCLLSIAPAYASGTHLTKRQEEIIQTVLAADGFIDRQLHAEFWMTLPVELRTNSKAYLPFVRQIESTLGAAARFQREAWSSMRLSLLARQVTKTAEYEGAKEAALNALPDPTYREQARRGVNNAERMIIAASLREAMPTARGPIYITEDLVDQVLRGLDGSIARFQILLNPEWKPDLK